MSLTQKQLAVIYEYEQILKADETYLFSPMGPRVEIADGEYRLTETAQDIFDTPEEQERLFREHDRALDFAYAVEEISCGNFNKGEKIRVCDTPAWLRGVGFDDLPVYYSAWHIHNALKDKSEEIEYSNNGHGLRVEQIQSLPFVLDKMPAVLLDNSSRKDCMLMVLPTTDRDNLPIIASIKPNAELHGLEIEGIETNMLMTVFGKEHFDDYLKNNFTKDDYIYINGIGVEHLRELTELEIVDDSLEIPENRILKTPVCIEKLHTVNTEMSVPDQTDIVTEPELDMDM